VRWGEEGERRLVVHHGRPRKKKGDGNEGADSTMTGGKEKGGGSGPRASTQREEGGWRLARREADEVGWAAQTHCRPK
jgi:hypothetical protein